MEGEQKGNLQKVKILRNRLCIGFQEGLDLLKQTDGDVERASEIFKEKILSLTEDVIKLPAEKIKPYLERYKYDAGRTIDALLDKYRLVDGVPQSEPVYILHKFRNYKNEAIAKIAALIIKKEKLARKWNGGSYDYPWLKDEDIKPLDEYSLCVVAISDWLDFEDSEAFDAALFYHLDLVADQLLLLQMPDLAAALRMARDIYKELIEEHKSVSKEFYTALRKDSDFREAQKYFMESKPLLVEKLYNFIQDNLDKLSL
jgi:hypothetical protein